MKFHSDEIYLSHVDSRWLKYHADYSRQRRCYADNVVANAGSGGATFATDQRASDSVHFPLTKLVWGPLDTFTVVDTGAGALPIADGGNSITIDGAVSQSGTWNIGTVTTLTGITNALPAGTNAIGKLAANSGVDIGDVDVTSIIPGTGATNLGKAIDTALGATDTGVLALSVRDDALATLTEADGDVSALRVDSTGRLWCNVSNTVTVASHAVTNAGTFAVQVDALSPGTAASNLGKAEDAAHTSGDVGVMAMSVRQDTAAALGGTDADYQPLITDGSGRLHVNVGNTAAVTPRPETSGGLSISRDIDLDNGALTVVKGSAGQLYGWSICNTGTVTVFVKFYDAASGTLGTGTPVLTIGIPGNSSDDTLAVQSLPYGIVFATGICVGAGTGVADADNTDPGANVVVANIYYK